MTPWTATNDAMLSDLWSRGFTARQIADKLHLTRNAICGRVYRLRHYSKTQHRFAKAERHHGGRWTVGVQDKIVALYKAGVSLDEIAASFGGSRKAVSVRLHSLGYGGRPRVKGQRTESTLITWIPFRLLPASPALVTGAHAVAYSEARGTQCHFPLWDDSTPVWDRKFCGNPVEIGTSWCACCRKRVFNDKARW
jgi:hypothetical protein